MLLIHADLLVPDFNTGQPQPADDFRGRSAPPISRHPSLRLYGFADGPDCPVPPADQCQPQFPLGFDALDPVLVRLAFEESIQLGSRHIKRRG
jgi:hypothetical protein